MDNDYKPKKIENDVQKFWEKNNSFKTDFSKTKNKKGTVIRPPPIPNSPAKKPTGKAVSIINKMKKKYSFAIIVLINLTYRTNLRC